MIAGVHVSYSFSFMAYVVLIYINIVDLLQCDMNTRHEEPTHAFMSPPLTILLRRVLYLDWGDIHVPDIDVRVDRPCPKTLDKN